MSDSVELTEHIHLAIASFFCAAIALWIARSLGFFHFNDQKPLNTHSLALWQVLGGFAVFIGIGVVIMPIVALIWTSLTGKNLDAALAMPFQGWFNDSTIILTAFSVALYAAWLPRNAQSAVARQTFSRGSQIIRDLALGACAWLISYPLVVFVGQIIAVLISYEFPPSHIDQVAVKYLKMTMDYPEVFALTAFLLIIVVPVIEETLFRGFLQSWLRQYFSMVTAIVLTSVVFASFHFSVSQGIENVELITSLFILSCFLGYLYERQQSLFASIGLHVTFNAISVVAILLSEEFATAGN